MILVDPSQLRMFHDFVTYPRPKAEDFTAATSLLRDALSQGWQVGSSGSAVGSRTWPSRPVNSQLLPSKCPVTAQLMSS